MSTGIRALICVCSALLQAYISSAQCGSTNEGDNYGLNNFPNTYYTPAAISYNLQATVTSSIVLTPASIVSSVSNPDIKSGDLVVIIQMQAAAFNSSNTASYGNGLGTGGGGYYNDVNLLAGNYEFAVAVDGTNVTSASGGTLLLAKPVKNNYKYAAATAVMGQCRYQVVKVPQFNNVGLASNIMVPAWNGQTGGVLFLEANQACNLNGFGIIADGRGFRGGGGVNYTGTPDFGANNVYRYLSTVTAHGSKGEGIAGTPRFIFNNISVIDNGVALEGYPNGSFGKGAPGTAGGGATDNKPAPSNFDNQFNTGGGGGGNGGRGGKGGWPWNNTPGVLDKTENGGREGSAFAEATIDRIIMGGGGGAGSTNNSGANNTLAPLSSGAPGGGIICINASRFNGSGYVAANGSNGANITGSIPGFSFSDASGGGGAGGTILLHADDPSGLALITASAIGGRGGSNYYGQHGPGGGGGGGVIYSNGSLLAADVSGGINGQTGPGPGNLNSTDPESLNYGATPGNAGSYIVSTNPIDHSYCIVLAQDNRLLVHAKQAADNVTISWNALPGTSIAAYYVEHAATDGNWQPIGKMIADVTATSYTFNHAQPLPGVNHYRIKVDYTGLASGYSPVVSCIFNSNSGNLVLQKTNNGIEINSSSLKKGRYALLWTDISGRIVYKMTNITVNPGSTPGFIQWPSSLKNGLYLLTLGGPDSFAVTEKLFW